MADAPSSLLLMKNVQDLRKRLIDTEKNLRTLTELESEETDVSRGQRTMSVTSRRLVASRPELATDSMSYRRDNTDDFVDRESIRSGLSTLPDSYTGFLERPFPASTPKRPETYSRRLPDEDSQSDVDARDMDSSHGRNRTQPDTGSKVMRQNHRLLSEVERLAYELQTANSKIRELTEELDSNSDIVGELEDKIEGLHSETDAQDKALRTAEERYEECQRSVSHLQNKADELHQDVDDLRTELNNEKKLRRNVEKQRDEALQNFLESQESLSTYQKRMKEKVKVMEEGEDYLREMLSHVSHERDDLVHRVSSFEDTVENQEKELQRLQSLEALELETRNEMEQQNMEMNEEIRKLKSVLIRLQAEADARETLMADHTRLKMETEKQQQQLTVCQQDVEEARTVLLQLDLLAQQIQQHSQTSLRGNESWDSGMHSWQGPRYNTSASSVNRDNSNDDVDSRSTATTKPGGARVILSDLRLQLLSKDEEIQRLRSSLESRENQRSSASFESLQADLGSLQEKYRQESEKRQELELVIGQLEMDKSRLAGQLTDLQRSLADRDSQNVALDSRITQRNTQIIELQEEINKKCTDNSNLERELRKKTLRLSSIEEQLDEKMREFSTHIARMKQLEEELISRGEENRALQDQIERIEAARRDVQQAHDKLQHTHNNQCEDYEKQIDRLQEQVEKKASLLQEHEKDLISVKGELAEKSSKLDHTEQALEELKKELSLRTQQSESMHSQLERLSTEGRSQMKQLESSLCLCQEEIRTCMTNLNMSREQFSREVKQKDEQISRLTSESSEMRQELNAKLSENASLGKSLIERQTMLQQATQRIADLEENQQDLNTQVAYLEQQVVRDKAQFRGEIDTAERKLHQALSDLEQKSAELSDLSQNVRSLQDEKRHLLAEVSSAERRLQEERDEEHVRADRLARLERDVRDLRVQLEHKIELVSDLEDQLTNKEEDMKQQLQLVNELDAEVQRLKDCLKESKQQAAKTDDELQRALFDVKAKEDMLNDLRDALRKTQEELDAKCDELYEMQRALDDRQRELQERMSQVNELDHTIKETHSEMEKRMQRLDSQLQKYETEINERTKQIANLDDSLQQTQTQLREKSLQLQQMEQLAQRQQLELQATTAKLDELEKASERQKEKIDEQREENMEVTQELRLTREQLQHLHGEFMATRRELAQAHRERDRLARELEDMVAASQSKETDTARLAEELGASQAREAEAEARLQADLDLLKSQMEELKENHRDEIEQLTDSLSALQSTNEDALSQLAARAGETESLESRHRQQLDAVRADVDVLHRELMARKESINAASETIVLRESEIARLQARLSGYERAAVAEIYSTQRATVIAQGDSHGPTPVILLQTAPHEPLHHEPLHHAPSRQPPDPASRAAVNGAMDSPTRPASGPLSPPGSEHAFQEMLVEASRRLQPDPRPVGQSNGVAKGHRSEGRVDDAPAPVTDSQFGSDSDTRRLAQGSNNAHVPRDKGTSCSPRGGRAKRVKSQGDFPILHDDPYTAVRVYDSRLSIESPDSGLKSEQSLVDLHERLRSNQLQQQEIERQLQSLNIDDSADAEVAALT